MEVNDYIPVILTHRDTSWNDDIVRLDRTRPLDFQGFFVPAQARHSIGALGNVSEAALIVRLKRWNSPAE